jgi:hypothetical protein
VRRLLAFLIPFVAGVALLVWLDDPPKRPEPSAPTTAETATGASDEAGVVLDGKVYAAGFEPTEGAVARRRWVVTSRDSSTVQQRDELLDVVAELFDPPTGDLEAHVEAARGVVQRTGAVTELEMPIPDERIDLEVVTGQLLIGMPIVPLDFSTATLAVDLERRLLRTYDRANVDGEGLAAEGRGLEIGLAGPDRPGYLRFESEGRVALDHRSGERITLTSGGQLLVQQNGEPVTADAPRPFTLDAYHQARIETEGEQALELDAERIRIYGHTAPGPEARSALDRVVATGNAVLRTARGEVRDSRIVVTFTADGQPQRAVLDDAPRAMLRLGDDDDATPGTRDADLELRHSAGMHIDWEADGMRFLVIGPCELALGDATLRGAGDVRGFATLDGLSFTLSAAESIALATTDGELITSGLRVDLTRRDAGTPDETRRLEARTDNGAEMTGTLADGRAFTMTTTGTTVALRQDERLTIPSAGGAVFTVFGELDAIDVIATAGRVRDFDPAGPSLVAEDDVTYVGPEGRGHGARLRMDGLESVQIDGDRDLAAHWDGLGIVASADRIRREGDTLFTSGDVVADYLPTIAGQDAYHVECETLRVDHDLRRDAGGGWERELLLRAEGGTRASVITADGEQEISADLLRARRIELFGSEKSKDVLASSTGIVAEGAAVGDFEFPGIELHLSGDRLVLDRRQAPGQVAQGVVRAEGNVHFDGEGSLDFAGDAAVFESDLDGNGSVQPEPGGRVTAIGRLPSHDLPFALEADRIDFAPERIEARRPIIDVERLAAPDAPRGGDLSARAERLVVTPEVLELEGAVEVDGTTPRGRQWRMRAPHVAFRARQSANDDTQLAGIDAWGGVEVEMGDFVRATGDRLIGRALLGSLRLEADPGNVARVIGSPVAFEAPWIEFDPLLQIVAGTGAGRALPAATAGTDQEHAWVVDHLGITTVFEPDSFIFVLQEPALRRTTQLNLLDEPSELLLRSTWAAFWVSRRGWLELPDRLETGPRTTDDLRALRIGQDSQPEQMFFHELLRRSLGDVGREVYFEGPVECHLAGELLSRFDAVYLDIATGHGWLADATLNVPGDLIGLGGSQVRVKADWLRYSSDGSLQSQEATLTPCDQEEPHVRIVTGDFRMRPARSNGKARFNFELHDNRVELYDALRLPLPPIVMAADKEGNPLYDTLRIGNSSRFGSFVEAGVSLDAGVVGEKVNALLGGNPFDYDATYSVRGSWLGSRGGMLDLGLMTSSKDEYWFDLHLGTVFDKGEDRGYVRVYREGHSDIRKWLRARGRYHMDDREWLEVGASVQDDAAVQSEFYEGDFTRYEQDETFLRWRKVDDAWMYDANLKAHVESFRTEIEELPSVGAFRGRTPLAELGGHPLIYTGEARVDMLRRREGDPPLVDHDDDPLTPPIPAVSPFGFPATFADGLGERDVLRFDTSQRLELPVPLGFGGLRATPFVGARGTFWDEAATGDGSPSRVVAEAGLRLATMLWRPAAGGGVHQLVPFAQVRGDVVSEESGGTPVTFDEVEDPVDGEFIDLGLRGRFDVGAGGAVFDAELRATHATGVTGRDDGWLPGAVFARLAFEPWQVPLQVWHDARYDLSRGDTQYSLTAVGLQPGDRFEMEAVHRRGDDLLGDTLFNAATLSALFRATEKWELQASQTVDLTDSGRLGSRFVVRRFGHDMIVDLDLAFRAGEGGASFGVSLKPRFGYKPRSIGVLNY